MERLAVALEAQGCTVIHTTNGLRILHPDGVHTLGIHYSNSDVRAIRNIKAAVQRIGLVWPAKIMKGL